MSQNLSSTAARGAAITLSGQAARIILQFVGVIILSRLLSPEDYGLITIVVIVIGVGEIFRDFGLSSAAVRSPTLSSDESTNLFWVNTGLGILLGGCLFAAAGPLADAAGHDAVGGIARALSCIFVFNGIATQFRALLMRNLRFRWLAGVDVSAAALALAIAVCCAVLGLSYWALVAQQLTQAIAVLIGVAWGARWHPSWPRRKTSIRSFLRFGSNLLLSQLVNYGANNADTAVVGFIYGTKPLGLYNRAYQLVVTPISQIQSPITSVAVPILSKIQDDHARFGAYLQRGQLAMSYPICMALGVIIATADEIVMLFLGSQWVAAVPLLRLFAIACIARTLAYVGYWVYVTRGLSAVLLRYSLVSASIRLVCIGIGAYWGVLGVAAGLAIAPWIAWPLSLAWLSRVTPIPTKALYGGAARIISVTAIATCSAFAITTAADLNAPMTVLLAVLVVIAILGLASIIPVFRRDARDLIDVAARLRNKIP